MRNTTINNYQGTTTKSLFKLADAGVTCLSSVAGSMQPVQRESLNLAIKLYESGQIDENNFRRRIRMVLNYCRLKIDQAWKNSPGKPSTVFSFLSKCVEADAKN